MQWTEPFNMVAMGWCLVLVLVQAAAGSPNEVSPDGAEKKVSQSGWLRQCPPTTMPFTKDYTVRHSLRRRVMLRLIKIHVLYQSTLRVAWIVSEWQLLMMLSRWPLCPPMQRHSTDRVSSLGSWVHVWWPLNYRTTISTAAVFLLPSNCLLFQILKVALHIYWAPFKLKSCLASVSFTPCVCAQEKKNQVRDQFNLMEFVIDLRRKIESHKINKGQRRGEEGHRSVKGESEMPLKAS